jgi:hypothetical protein
MEIPFDFILSPFFPGMHAISIFPRVSQARESEFLEFSIFHDEVDVSVEGINLEISTKTFLMK